MQTAMDTLTQDFSAQLNFSEEKVDDEEMKKENEDNGRDGDDNGEESDDDDDDDDFSFVFDGVNNITADETQLVFPLFDTDLLRLPVRPPVKHVYAATSSSSNNDEHPVTSSSPGDDVIAGPCCEWSKDNKKSNSTGFSKLWRFRDFAHRSNSDGKDAFVFLNHHPSSTSSKPKINVTGKKKVDGAVKVNGENNNKKKKNATALAHERYMKSKAKDEERKRSYLPYRPELVGFFTNVNGGGLTRNIHPY